MKNLKKIQILLNKFKKTSSNMMVWVRVYSTPTRDKTLADNFNI